MAADPTIYCLEAITDYFEFERLCHDLMSLEGYKSIEPLGGFSDKGRDAIHINKSNETTIFAYSVREDWRAKLVEDAEKVYKHGHACSRLIFVTTAKLTAHQRDEAIAYIYKKFGWQLELFGVERLRILLDVSYPQIKKHHPGLFPPEFLAIQDRISASTERDRIFISCVPEDAALADWLTRKLTAEGYLVWCERFKLLGGETYPKAVDEAIKNRTFRFLGLYSQASLKNPEVMRQRTLALNIANERVEDFLIPLNVDGVSVPQLDQVTRTLMFIPFKLNWGEGLNQLLKKLKSIECPRLLYDGKRIATEAFLQKDILSDQEETISSNCLQVQQIPEVIYCFKTQNPIPRENLNELEREWSYRKIDRHTFLSFHRPPVSVFEKYNIIENGGSLWPAVKNIYSIWSLDLVSELIRKALIVKCYQKKLQYCPKMEQPYFPENLVENNRLNFNRPDGTKTYITATGKRKHQSGHEYLYSLSPTFFVRRDLINNFTVLIRIKVRLSNKDGNPFNDKRTIDSRRKHLCKNWWNNDWLNRVLAVVQFLADEKDEQKITIGGLQDAQIIVNSTPMRVYCPIGINEAALDALSHERSELLRNYDDEHFD